MAKQLFEKQNTDYKKFNPLVYFKDILETDSDETIAWILNNYCHFYVEWQGSIVNTRLEVPVILRKHGVWITYNDGRRLITEQYVGTNKNIENTEKWISNTNWKVVNKEEVGVPLVDIEARIKNVESSDTAEVQVEVEGERTLAFSFKLPRGERGQDGANGLDGKEGNGTEYIYYRNNGEYPPAPNDILVDSDQFQGKGPYFGIPYVPASWTAIPQGVSDTHKYEWVAARRKVNNVWSAFSNPVIWAKYSTDGVDGLNVEFIYRLEESELIIPDRPTEITGDDVAPAGWTDSPSGISETKRCEWVCTRKKDLDSAVWGEWSDPVIWSKWSVDGRDGDGVEYIFKRNNGETLDNPTPNNISTDAYQEVGDYAGVEYVPTGWTDNPVGVDANNVCEWVCLRKYRNGQWGRFSNPALWAKFGENGTNGISLRTLYAKTDSSTEIPPIVRNNINPGSIWGAAIPTYTSPEAIWQIQAYVNYKNELVEVTAQGEKVYGWQGPVIMSGTQGPKGDDPNYKIWVFKSGTTKPDKPTGTSKTPVGWKDYPDDPALQWWQSVGLVNGITQTVMEWSEVLQVNGRDGDGIPGKYTELRFAVNDSHTTPPELDKAARIPTGWTTTPPRKEEGQAMWETMAIIKGDGSLETEWCDPFCISGETGPQGGTGPAGPPGATGPTGIPGVSFEVKYCLGTDSTYDGTRVPAGDSPTGWQDSLPSVTETKPYIWCIQGKRTYTDANDTKGSVVWQTPFRLSGINGLSVPGKRGQIVYPAGIYNPEATYTTTELVAPYVFYPSTQKYYVLNAVMSWVGTKQTTTPDKSSVWVEFQSYDAIYANIGIIENGLIGSAVFNNEFMFSQQGINASGGKSTDYEKFNPFDPYNENNEFRPNWCVNLATGAMWVGAGNICFNPDGSSSIGQWEINSDGALHRRNNNGIINISPTQGIVIMDTNGVPKAQLALDGSGKFAGGNISWTDNGIVINDKGGNSYFVLANFDVEDNQLNAAEGAKFLRISNNDIALHNYIAPGRACSFIVNEEGLKYIGVRTTSGAITYYTVDAFNINPDGSGQIANNKISWNNKDELTIDAKEYLVQGQTGVTGNFDVGDLTLVIVGGIIVDVKKGDISLTPH